MAEDKQGGSPDAEPWSKTLGSLYISQCQDTSDSCDSWTSYSVVETMKVEEECRDVVVEHKTQLYLD